MLGSPIFAGLFCSGTLDKAGLISGAYFVIPPPKSWQSFTNVLFQLVHQIALPGESLTQQGITVLFVSNFYFVCSHFFSLSSCVCSEGQYLDPIDGCLPCPSGSYQPNIGNSPQCIGMKIGLVMPTNMNSLILVENWKFFTQATSYIFQVRIWILNSDLGSCLVKIASKLPLFTALPLIYFLNSMSSQQRYNRTTGINFLCLFCGIWCNTRR